MIIELVDDIERSGVLRFSFEWDSGLGPQGFRSAVSTSMAGRTVAIFLLA